MRIDGNSPMVITPVMRNDYCATDKANGGDQTFLSTGLPGSYKIVEAAFQVTYYEHIILANGSAQRKFCRLP